MASNHAAHSSVLPPVSASAYGPQGASRQVPGTAQDPAIRILEPFFSRRKEMAIDYFIRYSCKVQDSASVHDLLRMQRARNRANASIAAMSGRAGLGSGVQELERAASLQALGGSGLGMRKLEIADLIAKAAPLDSLSRHCNGCPANLRGTAFGCGGAIQYPISRDAEQWLVSRLPDDLRSERGQFFLLAVQDLGFNGAGIDAGRSERLVFASNTPVLRRWGGFFSREKTWISSSQVLHMLIGAGNLSPIHARLACWFLGFLDAGAKHEHRPDNLPIASDSQGVIQFKIFLAAAAFAGANGYHLLIDA